MIEQESRTFGKSERIAGKIRIESIFKEGKAFLVYPFRVIYCVRSIDYDGDSKPALLISIPKKRLKRAVKRNRMKRLAKEAYRLNKTDVTNSLNIDVSLIYVADTILPFSVISKSIKRIMEELVRRCEK